MLAEIPRVPSVLAELGIRLVIVDLLPSSRRDGACLWLEHAPVIALSLRFNRIDNFCMSPTDAVPATRQAPQFPVLLAKWDPTPDKPRRAAARLSRHLADVTDIANQVATDWGVAALASVGLPEAIWMPRLALASGQKALWVSNRVRRCQAVGAAFGGPSTALLHHSRYRYVDRVQRHHAVVDGFKKDGALLASTTQVCEVSLDLSADLLVTDLASIPALIQRLGRLNRAHPDSGANQHW